MRLFINKMKYIIPEEPSENPDRIKMWKHYCNVENSLMEIGEGEPCNWCGKEEKDGSYS